MKRLVIPGEILADKPLRLDHTLVEDGKTCSTIIGLFDDQAGSFIPIEGLWYPQPGEKVVGIVDEARLNTDSINLNAPYKGLIISKFTEGNLVNGDIIEATVKDLDKTGTVVLVRPRPLYGGKVLAIKPSKVPRLLGKNDTMIKQIAEGTKSSISVGMNGLVWVKGGNSDLATDAILKIQEEAHVSGLTERIAKMVGASNQM
ncbi:MAG TPA: KH domain-containing protein [Candidatus Saccharimonadales bacterium]|nr:KH domain-containing protein [Candidatus Saccharimonadales bacterium]